MLFLSLFEKGQKWPNHFIFGKQFQKRQNLADLAFKKAKWQPCLEPPHGTPLCAAAPKLRIISLVCQIIS
jgi:hypothetical protein